MTEYKKSNEIKSFLKNKRRKKRLKKIIMCSIIVIVAMVLFVTQSSLFNIKTIDVLGTSKINSDKLKENLKQYIGENIFVIDISNMKEILMEDQYINEVNIARKGITNLVIDIVEEAPVFYVENEGVINIINEELEIIEQISSIEGMNYVEISGVEIEKIVVGEKINDDEIYSVILQKFYPYISQNKENIKFDEIDISDIVNIKGKMGNVEVFFGDDSDIHNKMENVYRIMLSEEIKLINGYIDVSFDGPPIIKKATN